MNQAQSGMMQLADLQAENAVLGSILINPSSLPNLAELLQPGDFYNQAGAWVFGAALQLMSHGIGIDPVTMANQLKRDGHLVDVGGAAGLNRLISDTPTSMNAASYAQIVGRLSTLRKLVGASAEIAKLAYNGRGRNVDEVFSRAKALVDAAAPIDDESILLGEDTLDFFFETQDARAREIKEIAEGKRAARPDLPWKAISPRYVKFVRPGTLGIVSADSSVGKTVFMACCAEYWARLGLNVCFFHLELSKRLMQDRRMARHSGVPLGKIEDAYVDGMVVDAAGRMSEWARRLHYVRCPGWSAQHIAVKIRQLRAKGLCDIAVIDYIQKIHFKIKGGQNEAAALGDVTETIKNCAEQLGIPIWIGSQISRVGKKSRRITADAIRGSGSIGNKANIVITLDREILDNDVTDDTGKLIAAAGDRSPDVAGRVDKNTTGPTGDFTLRMNAARFLIFDVAIGQTPPLGF